MCGQPTRREFLGLLGQGAAACGVAGSCTPVSAGASGPQQVAKRTLGRTGLRVSEIGFGGHSWNFARVPDGQGGLRRTSLDEAMRMIGLGLDMGVNFFDSCTPREEHSVPGEVIKRLKRRDEILVSARLCHKMKGVEADKEIVYRWVDERLKLWQTDRFDLLLLTNSEGDTPQSGYWDMSYSLEALDKLKQQGKIRYSGFGCHFTAEWFREAFKRFGRQFDVVSMPYNIRHRLAEELFGEARRLGLGIITIKSLARGDLLKRPAALENPVGLSRDMIAFVLENQQVDCCICGVHTEEHVRENFSASWTKLTPQARQRLEKVAASGTPTPYGWLERGWLGGRYC